MRGLDLFREQGSPKPLTADVVRTTLLYKPLTLKDMKQIKSLLSVLLALLIVLPMAAQEERTIKRKVAIGRFSNETQYAKGLFYDKENDPMRKQALAILSSKLARFPNPVSASVYASTLNRSSSNCLRYMAANSLS